MKQVPIVLLVVGTALGLPPSDRIYGGTYATAAQFPFIASLNNPNPVSDRYQFCSAAIINENWLVTAAYCVEGVTPDTAVLVGTNNQHSGGTTYNISKAIRHEGFDWTTLQNDIGLIQIDGTFQFGRTIQAIEFGDPEVNATCEVLGWGTTELYSYPEELRYIEVTILDLENCIVRSGDENHFYLGPEQVCTLAPVGKGRCFGDSGAPLSCGGTLAGLVSFVVSSCAQGLPDVYVRPSAYADWIAANMQ